MSSPNLSHRCLKEAKPTKLNTFFGFSSFPKTCKPESAKENLDSRLEHFPAAAPLFRTCGKMKMWAQALAGWVTLAGLLAVPAAAFRCALHHRLARFRR